MNSYNIPSHEDIDTVYAFIVLIYTYCSRDKVFFIVFTKIAINLYAIEVKNQNRIQINDFIM